MPDFLVVFNVVALEIIIKGKWVTTTVHWQFCETQFEMNLPFHNDAEKHKMLSVIVA